MTRGTKRKRRPKPGPPEAPDDAQVRGAVFSKAEWRWRGAVGDMQRILARAMSPLPSRRYGIATTTQEAEERRRYDDWRFLLALSDERPDLMRTIVRYAESALKKAVGTAPKKKRKTKMDEFLKKLPDGYIDKLRKRLPEREVIAHVLREAHLLGLDISAATIRRYFKPAKKVVSRN